MGKIITITGTRHQPPDSVAELLAEENFPQNRLTDTAEAIAAMSKTLPEDLAKPSQENATKLLAYCRQHPDNLFKKYELANGTLYVGYVAPKNGNSEYVGSLYICNVNDNKKYYISKTSPEALIEVPEFEQVLDTNLYLPKT